MKDAQDLDDDNEEFEDPSWSPRQAANELARLFDCESEDGEEIEFPPEPGFTVDEYISLGSREPLEEWDSLSIPMSFLTNLLWTLAKYGFGYVEDELIHPVVYQFSSIQWDKTPIEFYRVDELTTYAPSAVFTRGHLIQELSRLELDDARLFRELSADFGVVEFAGNFDVPLWAAYRAQQSSRIADEARVLWHQIREFRSQEAQERIRMRTERLEEKEFQKWLRSESYVGEEFRTAEALESAREEAIDEQVARKVRSEKYPKYLPTADDENLRES